ncbi:MAG: hypothetical protein E6J48_12865 [Chloroflexi bacterium]|nr:MAG: hypothetical protein E6J48_12865 [Chloroflexota bacterium]
MKRFSYGERDYAFGQRMLTLRTTIGLTQANVAQHLGVSRKAVGGWEADLTGIGFLLLSTGTNPRSTFGLSSALFLL